MAEQKKRGRPKGSKNKPKVAFKAPIKADPLSPLPTPLPDEDRGSEANCGPNGGILDDAIQAEPRCWKGPYHGIDPEKTGYPLDSNDLEWAIENLKAIQMGSEWATRLTAPAKQVVREIVQALWKRHRRPPGVDEIVQESALSWSLVEDSIYQLVEDERLIRAGGMLIPVNVEKRKPEPEAEEDGPVLDTLGESIAS